MLRVDSSCFDANPELLNFTNGYLNLRTLEFTRHNSGPMELFRHCVGYDYDPDAQCPRWERFLADTHPGDDALPEQDRIIRYLQYAGGTALTGRMSPNRDVYWIRGQSTTGKSVFLNQLIHVLGTREARGTGYARALDNTLLMRGAQNSRMGCTLDGLDKIRLVAFNELPGGRVDVTQFRILSSSDAVQVRGNYKEGRDAFWSHTLFTTTNFEPLIENDDDAIWERIRVIEFTNRVPDDKKDPELENKLKAEVQGICNWFVQGAQRVLSDPREYIGRLPKAITESGKKYQESMDLLQQFFDDALQPADETGATGGGVPVIDTETLFEVFLLWTRRQNMQWKPNKARFKTMLRNKGHDPDHRYRTLTEKRIRGLPGFTLQSSYLQELRKELDFKGRHIEAHYVSLDKVE